MEKVRLKMQVAVLTDPFVSSEREALLKVSQVKNDKGRWSQWRIIPDIQRRINAKTPQVIFQERNILNPIYEAIMTKVKITQKPRKRKDCSWISGEHKCKNSKNI